MFKDNKQACETIRALLRRVHLERLWTGEGPTAEAVQLLRSKGGWLSDGEKLMLRVAFDFWNNSGQATVDDLVSVLDSANFPAILDALGVARPDIRDLLKSPAFHAQASGRLQRHSS